MPVDTKNVSGRRELHFSSLDEVLAEVERLAAASSVHTAGNWSLGQILWHLAKVMNDSIDGSTIRWTTPPRVVPEPIKTRVLTGSLRPGFTLPPDAARELEPPPCSADEGLRSFRAAVARQKTETHREPNPFFGPLTLDEWNLFQCRHAELHLSFVVPAE